MDILLIIMVVIASLVAGYLIGLHDGFQRAVNRKGK